MLRRKSQASPSQVVRVPHDPINEVVLLAAVMVDERARRYLDTIPADSFYGKGHAAAWAALQELRRQGLDYDPATLRQVAGDRVDVESLGEYLEERPRPPPNLKHHARMVEWDRVRVEAVRGPLASLLESVRDPTSAPDKVRALAKRVGESFDGFGDARFLREPASLLREQSGELTARREGRAVYPYGLQGLDYYDDGRPRMIPGCAPGKMTMMVGVSGSGKTTATARIVLEQISMGRRVLLGAWEQGSGMTLELLATLSLGWCRSDVSVGAYDVEEQRELEQEMEVLAEQVRFFELPFGKARGEKTDNDRNLDLVHQYLADTQPDLFVADLFRRTLKETKPDDEEKALDRMQAITQAERCHSLLVHQLRLKDLEAREDKRPTRESIKGSGAWIEVSDAILAVHRPAIFKNIPDDKLQVIVLKQRYGKWPIASEHEWNPEYGSITDGRDIEYDRPGTTSEEGLDGFLGGETLVVDKPIGKGRRRR